MSHERVFNSPINTSIAKHLYSIPKAERFQKTKQSQCSRSFYDIKSTFQHSKTTNLGLGKRSEIANLTSQSPDPGCYNYDHSPFNQNRNKKRGFSFAIKQKAPFPFEVHNPDHPGPTKYNLFFKSNQGYTIRNKYDDPMQRGKSMTLGPGQYKNAEQNLSKTGAYFNCRFRNSLCTKIGRQKRFNSDNTVVPGPGAYKNKLSMNRTGSYFDSRIKSSIVASFRGTSRLPINDKSESPGPGAQYIYVLITMQLCFFGVWLTVIGDEMIYMCILYEWIL